MIDRWLPLVLGLSFAQALAVPAGQPVGRLRRLAANRGVRFTVLVLYYLAIILGLVVMYGRGDFSTPSFVYQGF